LRLYPYRQVYLQPDYQYTTRASDLEGGDYSRNQFFLRLGIQL